MTLYTKTIVVLDPVTEAQTVREYEEDSNWVKTADETVAVVFEHVSPTAKMEPVHLSTTRMWIRS